MKEFSAQPDRYKGKEHTVVRDDVGIGSDGKYTSHNEIKYSFADGKPIINVNMSCKDDDGQREESTGTIDKGRDLINFARDNKHLKIFDDVQDVVGKL